MERTSDRAVGLRIQRSEVRITLKADPADCSCRQFANILRAPWPSLIRDPRSLDPAVDDQHGRLPRGVLLEDDGMLLVQLEEAGRRLGEELGLPFPLLEIELFSIQGDGEDFARAHLVSPRQEGQLARRHRDDGPLHGLVGRPAVLPGDGPQELIRQPPAPLPVGHDHGPLALLEERGHLAPEALVGAAVPEARGPSEALDGEPQPVAALPGRRHLPGLVLREDRGIAARCLADLEEEAGQVGRRRPQPGGGHLGIGVYAARKGLAFRVVRRRGRAAEPVRKRLLVSAVGHAQGPEDQLGEKRREGLSRRLLHQELGDREAAPRIAPYAPREDVDEDGLAVGRLFAAQDLDGRRNGSAGRIASEAGHGQPGRMAQQAPQGDRLAFG
ncbi:MAG: hypothetical protein MZV63_66440 [Marinilabiliales bacterium]|nr:hypothetical protein [Marinilabiliales bacterium]